MYVGEVCRCILYHSARTILSTSLVFSERSGYHSHEKYTVQQPLTLETHCTDDILHEKHIVQMTPYMKKHCTDDLLHEKYCTDVTLHNKHTVQMSPYTRGTLYRCPLRWEILCLDNPLHDKHAVQMSPYTIRIQEDTQ